MGFAKNAGIRDNFFSIHADNENHNQGTKMRLIKDILNRFKLRTSCCETKNNGVSEGLKKMAIVGSPNVGKSVLFNNLTKYYVTVSNYPGTTVEVSRGKARIEGIEYEIIDTPGMYSLSPITEEERIARRILIKERPCLVIHVYRQMNAIHCKK